MADHTPTTLLSFADRDAHETHGKLAVRLIGHPWEVRRQYHNPFSFRVIPHLLQADVIHCHQTHVLISSFAAACGRVLGRRVFTSDLGGGGWDISSYLSTDRWYRGHLHISLYSQHVARHDDQPFSKVIWGGVDTEKFSPLTHEDGNHRSEVLYVGRVLPHKGINDLVCGLPPDLKLRIIGKFYHEQFAQELQRMSEGKNVVFETSCADDALVEAYRRALCIVLPSVYRDMYGNETLVPELLGQTLLEGMACGVPAICTNVASLPEIVVDGETGFIVPPNDPAALKEKLVWLRDHPAEGRRMGQAARARITQLFAWPRVVQRCFDAYQGS